jgi:hypothetical protein
MISEFVFQPVLTIFRFPIKNFGNRIDYFSLSIHLFTIIIMINYPKISQLLWMEIEETSIEMHGFKFSRV